MQEKPVHFYSKQPYPAATLGALTYRGSLPAAFTINSYLEISFYRSIFLFICQLSDSEMKCLICDSHPASKESKSLVLHEGKTAELRGVFSKNTEGSIFIASMNMSDTSYKQVNTPTNTQILIFTNHLEIKKLSNQTSGLDLTNNLTPRFKENN